MSTRPSPDGPATRPEGDMTVGSTSAALGGYPVGNDMNGSEHSSPAPQTGTGDVKDVGSGRPRRTPDSSSGTSSTSIGGASGAPV